MALAWGIDGSLYVGDFNYIRRIYPSGNVTSVMELRLVRVLHGILMVVHGCFVLALCPFSSDIEALHGSVIVHNLRPIGSDLLTLELEIDSLFLLR